MQTKISIVTVAYNEIHSIESTILSILNQTYSNIEYIIVDGGSTDGTVDVIKKYNSKITNWVSEKDNGLYDAMNKGMNMATGDFLILINAGDKLFSNEIVGEFVDKVKPNIDIAYGKAELFYKNKNIYKPTAKKIKTNPCHNAIFFSRSVYKNNKHNTDYTISADSVFIKQMLQKYSSQYITDLTVCRFELGGVSNYYNSYKQFKQHLSDRRKIKHELKQGNYKYHKGNLLLSFKFIMCKLLGKDTYLSLYIRLIERKGI